METATAGLTLRDLLREKTDQIPCSWLDTETGPISDLIDRFNDDPESLKDFSHSDWVNLCEPYTRDLLNRWNQQEYHLKQYFNEYCEAIGATSTLEALESQVIDDPDDMATAMTNLAMTHAGWTLCSIIYPDY